MHLSRTLRLALAAGLALAALAAPRFATGAAAQTQDTARVAPAADTVARPAPAQPRQRRDRNRLTRAEILDGNQGSMLEVIRAKRPHWLRRNNGDRVYVNMYQDVALYVDGSDQSASQRLENIPPTHIVRAEYMSPVDAVVLQGARYSKGVIFLYTH